MRPIVRFKKEYGSYSGQIGWVDKIQDEEETPLGYTDLDKWLWKKDYPELFYYACISKKFKMIEQPDFFKLSFPGY